MTYSIGRDSGSFHVPNGRETLNSANWKVTTSDFAVGVAISKLLGGYTIEETSTEGKVFSIATRTPTVHILVTGQDAVEAQLILTKPGHPPEPKTYICFTLAERQELGHFSVKHTSWDFAESAQKFRGLLLETGEAISGALSLKPVTLQKGQRTISYLRPQIVTFNG